MPDWNEIESIFWSVIDLDEDGRRELLDTHCAGRSDVRAEVESLLNAHARAQGFMQYPTLAADAPDAPMLRVGDVVGSFRLVERIASGGMGTVYKAERADGSFEHQVAVKVIAASLGFEGSARRFRAERQILASLHHPNIVTLLDGGVTPRGEAYLVMEYVDGVPITQYVRDRKLSVAGRLRLFRSVCDAVQYAHAHSVVHRDLKPANVLVTADGVPKVLDFGVARLVEGPAVDGVGQITERGTGPLTPNYASPEQLRGVPVTTASDIYTLGVLLFEILTGTRPYETAGKPLDHVMRLVIESNTTRPSAAIPPADARPPYECRRALRGDIDAIALKALHKDPAQRYASADALSLDIGRYLDGAPVEAREPSFSYTARKLAARHRIAFASIALSAAAVVVALAIALWQARVARIERDRAQQRFQDLRHLANSVIYELHDVIANLPGATEARGLMVKRALEYLDRLAAEARDDTPLRRELADAYQRLAEVQNGGLGANLGDTRAGLESYRKALTIRRELADRAPADPRDVRGLAKLEFDLGALQRISGEAAASEQSFTSSAERLERLRASGTVFSEPPTLGAVYQRLAEVQLYLGESQRAAVSAQKAVSEAEAVWQRGPQDAAARGVLAAAVFQLAESLADADRYSDALQRVRQARALLETTLAENPLDARQTRILLYVLNAENRYLAHLNDLDGAVTVAAHALDVAEQALARDRRDNWSRTAVAVAAKTLGISLFQVGNTTESVRRLRQGLKHANDAAVEDTGNSFVRLEIASSEHNLAMALISSADGKSTEGCTLMRHVEAFWSALESTGQLPPSERAELREIPRWLARCSSASSR